MTRPTSELIAKLRSRAWEDRQHLLYRNAAADRLSSILKAWEAWTYHSGQSPSEREAYEALRIAITGSEAME